ncbi:carbohydrate ABC transporter permease [Halanaerobium kushneri]|uniref:Carbohydrate ABC transporter membrane protein 2, CUT1 family n=1 Tax=Halanaerobium kushneri TaxID=56779 RepID=A0A1N7AV13_9FIRM|nr:carbohydrate ABC transporter permease [Halanaerobium kushneri]SIR42949.1 carbohydrate ABC transporter membrane protein 2, CUT1 family [Halanaerobium kushneri]
MKEKTNWWATGLLFLGSFIIIIPLYMALIVSLKNPQQLAESILAVPDSFQFKNYLEAVKLTNYFQSLKNSAYVTLPTVAIVLVVNSMVSYAIARNMDKKYFKFLYFYFISAMFIPFPLIMLPLVKEMAMFSLDNLTGLILLYIVYALPLNVFIYVGYIKTLPKSIEEAAIIDGANVWQIFWRIIFPVLKPINATVAILTALKAWNDFLLPLLMISDRSSMTLPLVQHVFQSQFSTNYSLAFASYILALLPMLVVYIIAQKKIISGVMRGSVKG